MKKQWTCGWVDGETKRSTGRMIALLNMQRLVIYVLADSTGEEWVEEETKADRTVLHWGRYGS